MGHNSQRREKKNKHKKQMLGNPKIHIHTHTLQHHTSHTMVSIRTFTTKQNMIKETESEREKEGIKTTAQRTAEADEEKYQEIEKETKSNSLPNKINKGTSI